MVFGFDIFGHSLGFFEDMQNYYPSELAPLAELVYQLSLSLKVSLNLLKSASHQAHLRPKTTKISFLPANRTLCLLALDLFIVNNQKANY